MKILLPVVIGLGLLIGLLWPVDAPKASADVEGAAQKREVVLTRGGTGHFFTDGRVNDRGDVKFMVDTGATVVALTIEDARRLGIPVDSENFEVVAEGASGPVRGQAVTLKSVEVGGIKAEAVRAVIIEKGNLSLLGQSFLSRVDQVEMSGDYMSLRDES